MHDLEIQTLRNKLAASAIPEYMHAGIERYIVQRIKPGSFLTAVLSNDLRKAVEQADGLNITLLPDYVKFFYNYTPSGCWGSAAKVEEWLTQPS